MKPVIYVHRPCASIALSLTVGIILESMVRIPMNVLLLLMLVLFISLCVFGWIKYPHSGWLLCLFIAGGGMMLQANAQTLPHNHIGRWSWQEARRVFMIEGIVSSPPVVRQTTRGVKTSFEFWISAVCWDDQSCYKPLGKVLVNIFREEAVSYGDRLKLSGKLHKPFVISNRGNYSYEDHLKRNGIYWIFSVAKKKQLTRLASRQGNPLKRFIYQLHCRLKANLDQYLDELEAGLVQSLVLGGKYYLDSRTRDLFVQTGTAHILAISGMNVASMALLIFIFLNIFRLSRCLQLTVTIVLLLFYGFLTGSNPSVVRAVIMAVVLLTGMLFEREQDTLNSLGFAALVLLINDPFCLFDIGFQLSFAGVLSIVCLYPKIYACVEPRINVKSLKILGQALCVSLAAWVGTLPLIAYYFQVVTPISVLANIPIIPFVTALFMLGVGLIFSGEFLWPLADYFAACIKVVIWGLMWIVDLFSRIPYGNYLIKEVNISFVVVYYICLGVVFLLWPKEDRGKDQVKLLHYLN